MKWKIQFILYCKGHFSTVSGDTLHDLRHMYEQRVMWEGVTNKDVANYLLTEIVHPYILPHLPSHFLSEAMEDISPEFVWRTGYPNSLAYDYYSAVVYKLISLIKMSDVAHLPPELRTTKADTKLLMGIARPTRVE